MYKLNKIVKGNSRYSMSLVIGLSIVMDYIAVFEFIIKNELIWLVIDNLDLT